MIPLNSEIENLLRQDRLIVERAVNPQSSVSDILTTLWRNEHQEGLRSHLYSPALAAFIKHLPRGALASRVLDLGCGAGPGTIALGIEGVGCVIGLDHRLNGAGCKTLVERSVAAQLGSTVKAVIGEAPYLPFGNYTFDGIYCIDVLEHVPYGNQNAFIHEAYRVLRPGGIALIGMMNRLYPRDPHSRLLFAHYLPLRLFERYAKACGRFPKNGHWETFPLTLGQFRGICSRTGFEWVGGRSYIRRFRHQQSIQQKILEILARLRLPIDWVAGGCMAVLRKAEKG